MIWWPGVKYEPMAAPHLPDYDQLLVELVQLEQHEPELARRLERVQDRNTAFPNEVTARHVSTLSAELAELRTSILELRAQLVPIMRLRDVAAGESVESAEDDPHSRRAR